MKNLTIIGLGWLGLPLAEQLQTEGWQVAGTKRSVSGCPITCYPLDLNDLSISPELQQQLAAEKMVIALPPSTSSEADYFNGVQKLVSMAVRSGLQQLIFISSTSVLPLQTGRFDENFAISADNLLAKVEQWLKTLPIDCDILRLAGLVGKQRHPVFYLAGKSNLSGAAQPVNLVHLDDCIAAISLLLQNPSGQRIFHLCSPKHPTRQAYYTEIARRLGLADLHFSAENHPLVRIIEADKICREVGFRYRYADPADFPLNEIKKS